MGVGLAYTGQDSGWSKAAAKAAEAVGGIVGSFKGIKDQISKPLMEAKDRLVAFKNALPENLTTSFEGQLVAAEKAGHAQAAQLGYSTKAMGKFSREATNLGIGLNRSTEEAGKAIFAWEKGSDVLKSVGIDSKETALKVQDIFGVDMSKFVFTLKEMQKGLGMDDKAIKKLTDSTLAWGQQSGDVNKALGGMQEQVNFLQKRAHAFGKTLEGGELADWAENANQAKQLMFALTGNADKAESAVNSLNEQFLEQGRNMGKMFAGTSDDITDWQKHFAIAGVDIGQQFNTMKQGPLGFIKGMSTMVKKAGGFSKMTGDQMNFIKRQLEESLGPEVADQIFTVFQKGDNAVEDMIKKLPKATEDMGQLAKAAFRTGRTTAEWLQLYKDQFTTTLRSSRMVTVEVTKNGKTYKKQIPIAQKYLEDSKKGFADLSKRLLDLSKDNGPLGQVAGKIMDIQILGAAGLLPESMRQYVPVMEELAKQFGPILMGLGQMMPLISALASPMVLLVAAVAGLAFWFVSARKEGDSVGDTFRTMKGQLEGFALSAESFLIGKFPKYAKTIHIAITVLTVAFETILDVIGLVGDGFVAMLDLFESTLNGETNSLADFGDTIRNIWLYEIVGPIKNYFSEMWLGIKTEAKSVWEGLNAMVSTAVDFWVKTFKGAMDALLAPFVAIDEWVESLFRNSISSDIKADLKFAMELFDGFGRTAGKVLDAVLRPLSGLLPSVASASAGGGNALPPPMRPAPAVSAGERDASLIAAVHAPNWYVRYEQVFTARMQALENAMNASGGTGPQGGKTSTGRRPKGRSLPLDAGTAKFLATDVAGASTTVKE